MDAADEVADLLQGSFRLFMRGSDHLATRLWVAVELLPRCTQLGGEGDESLLCSVVEVTLDPATLALGGVDRCCAAGLEPRDLRGELLLFRRAEQTASDCPLGLGDTEGEPRCDVDHTDETDQRGHPWTGTASR